MMLILICAKKFCSWNLMEVFHFYWCDAPLQKTKRFSVASIEFIMNVKCIFLLVKNPGDDDEYDDDGNKVLRTILLRLKLISTMKSVEIVCRHHVNFWSFTAFFGPFIFTIMITACSRVINYGPPNDFGHILASYRYEWPIRMQRTSVAY